MSNVPEELKYTKEHEWVKVDGEIATVGITDYAQSQLTDVVFVDLPEVGKAVEKDKPMANIESVKSVSDIIAPVSGEVTEVNKALADAPEKVNQDCYGEAWIAKVKIKDKAELDALLSAEDYKKTIS
jgi:glycine cleavage system H protein